MRVGAYNQSWQVNNADELAKAMAWRDDTHGAIFFLVPDDEPYPYLAVRVTADYADVHYFSFDGHPGFRCLGGEGLPEGGWIKFVYRGCDPSAGKESPNKFVVPFGKRMPLPNIFYGPARDRMQWLGSSCVPNHQLRSTDGLCNRVY